MAHTPVAHDLSVQTETAPVDFLGARLERVTATGTLEPPRAVEFTAQPTSIIRVLIVEHDAAVGHELGRTFSAHGFQVRMSLHAESAVLLCQSWRPHLVLTDHTHLQWDGIELCRRIRAISPAGVIVLSKHDDEAMKVNALDSGADDYLTRPYSVTELMARSRAVLRRSFQNPAEEPLQIGAFRIDFDRRRTYVHEQEVKLTPKAFDLLVYFARHPNRVIERSCLLKAVWCEEATSHPEYLRAYIGQIRKRIEPDPSNPRYLLTESWVGYRFNPYDEPPTAGNN